MIEFEKLNQFIHEELKYKNNVEVAYCRIVNDKFLDIKLSKKGENHSYERGEIVDLKKYRLWLKKFEREDAIAKIID